MHLNRPPFRLRGRDGHQPHRAIAKGEGDGAIIAGKPRGDHEGVQVLLNAAGVDQEIGFFLDAAHATQASNPRRSFGRLRPRPMKTMRLVRGSPSFHSLMKSPAAIMCTA